MDWLICLFGSGIAFFLVHLTRAGHERMAAAVWHVLRPACEEVE